MAGSDRADTERFSFPGGSTGCLLVHGFSGTPYEMRYLGERLRDARYSVLGVRLPGHATLESHLYKAGWRDWYRAVAEGFDELSARCSTVAAVGLSMGALLVLRLAAERGDAVSRVAVLSTALVLSDTRLSRFAPVIRLAAWCLPARWAALSKEASDIADPAALRAHPVFPLPLRGLAELAALQKSVRALLPRVTQPVLTLHGRRDRTTPLENVEILQRELGSKQVRTVVFERSAHILGVDFDKEEVAAEVVRFLGESTHLAEAVGAGAARSS